MGKRPFIIGPALLPALLLACSSSGSPATNTSGTPPDLASTLATAFCEVEATCCGPTGTTTVDGGGTVPCGGGDAGATSSCLDRATLATSQQLALISTAFSEGLLTINAGVESTCATAYQEGLTCTTLGAGPEVQPALDLAACAGLFTGYIPVGERCDMTAECTAGSFCLSQGTGEPVTSIAGSGTLGVCFAYVEMGGACNTTNDCLPPLVCDPTTFLCQ